MIYENLESISISEDWITKITFPLKILAYLVMSRINLFSKLLFFQITISSFQNGGQWNLFFNFKIIHLEYFILTFKNFINFIYYVNVNVGEGFSVVI